MKHFINVKLSARPTINAAFCGAYPAHLYVYSLFLDSVKVGGFIRALSHFNNRKKLYVLCWHQIVFPLFLLFLSSGRLMTDLSWRWTGILSMTSYCQVEKTVNIRWAVFEYTFRCLWGGGVVKSFFTFQTLSCLNRYGTVLAVCFTPRRLMTIQSPLCPGHQMERCFLWAPSTPCGSVTRLE